MKNRSVVHERTSSKRYFLIPILLVFALVIGLAVSFAGQSIADDTSSDEAQEQVDQSNGEGNLTVPIGVYESGRGTVSHTSVTTSVGKAYSVSGNELTIDGHKVTATKKSGSEFFRFQYSTNGSTWKNIPSKEADRKIVNNIQFRAVFYAYSEKDTNAKVDGYSGHWDYSGLEGELHPDSGKLDHKTDNTSLPTMSTTFHFSSGHAGSISANTNDNTCFRVTVSGTNRTDGTATINVQLLNTMIKPVNTKCEVYVTINASGSDTTKKCYGATTVSTSFNFTPPITTDKFSLGFTADVDQEYADLETQDMIVTTSSKTHANAPKVTVQSTARRFFNGKWETGTYIDGVFNSGVACCEATATQDSGEQATVTVKPLYSGEANVIVEYNDCRIVFPVNCRKQVPTSKSEQFKIQLFDYTDVSDKWNSDLEKYQKWGCTVYRGEVNQNGLSTRRPFKPTTATEIDPPVTFVGGTYTDTWGDFSKVRGTNWNLDNKYNPGRSSNVDAGVFSSWDDEYDKDGVAQKFTSCTATNKIGTATYGSQSYRFPVISTKHDLSRPLGERAIDGQPAGYLFGTPKNVFGEVTQGVVVYPEVTSNFFRYNDTGGYYYFSTCGDFKDVFYNNPIEANSTFYDRETKSFKVYDRPVTTRETVDRRYQNFSHGIDYNVFDGDKNDYKWEQYGDFLPLSPDVDSITNENTGLSGAPANAQQSATYYNNAGVEAGYTSDPNPDSPLPDPDWQPVDPEKQEGAQRAKSYDGLANNTVNFPLTYRTEDVNYWYGMKMSYDFMIDEDAMHGGSDGVKHDEVFQYSGDDDIWVYVDGVKVLDLGGVHGRVCGNINFKTGEIDEMFDFVTASDVISTTLYDRFKAALGEATAQELLPLDESGVRRFADYTRHTIDFFYMERGGSVSTCNFFFNLPNVKSPIGIDKTWVDNDESKRPSSINYNIYRSLSPDTPKSEREFVETVELTSEDKVGEDPNHWATTQQVEIYKENTNQRYYYFVEEDDVHPYVPQGPEYPEGKNYIQPQVQETEDVQYVKYKNTYLTGFLEPPVVKLVNNTAGEGSSIQEATFGFKATVTKGSATGCRPAELTGTVTTSSKIKDYDVTWDGKFEFNESGDYEIQVTEDALPADSKWKKTVEPKGDAATFKIHVDYAAGVYTVSIVGEPQKIVFENEYTPDPVTGTINGTKTYDKEFADGFFQVDVKQTNPTTKDLTTINIPASGSWTLPDTQEYKDAFTFTKIGDYEFDVSEKYIYDDAHKGVKYDTKKYHVKFSVTDNAGDLKVERFIDGVKDETKSLDFTNHFKESGKKFADANAKDGDAKAVYPKDNSTIEYQLDVSNYKTYATDINITDKLSKGLDINYDGFKVFLDGAELSNIYYSREGLPSQDGITLKITIPEAEANSNHVITYTARVTADAYETNTVNNDAQMKIGEDYTYDLGRKTNVVPQKKYYTDEGYKTTITEEGEPAPVGTNIGYQIVVPNKTGGAVTFKFTDTLSKGLEYIPDSFKCNGSSVTPSIEGNKFSYSITTEDENVVLQYVCTVVSTEENKPVDHEVYNGATAQVGNAPSASLDPLHNPVPEKKIATEGLNPADNVKVGDTISYSIVGKNTAGKLATAQFKDQTSAGLELDWNDGTGHVSDGKFVLSYTDKDGNPATKQYKDSDFSTPPTHNHNFTTIDSPEIKDGTEFTFTYSCKVTEEAYTNGHKVQNDAAIKIANNNFVSLKPIPNNVSEKKYQDPSMHIGAPVKINQEIGYEVAGSNMHDKDAVLTISDTTSTGLVIKSDAGFLLTYTDENGAQHSDESVTPQTLTSNNFVFELKDHKVKSGTEFSLKYKAVVTEDALTVNYVKNGASITIDYGQKENITLIPLPNQISQKEYVDKTDVDRVLKVGDIVKYQIQGYNAYDNDAFVKFKDSPSEGLDIYFKDAAQKWIDGSFILEYSYTDASGVPQTVTREYKETDFKSVNNRGFETLGKPEGEEKAVVPLIPKDANFSFTYSCIVTEDAYKAHAVENDSAISVNNEDYVNLDSLYNPVPEKKFDEGSAAKFNGDNVHVGDIINYKIVGVNTAKTDASVKFTDSMTKGLKFVDKSFKLDGIDVAVQVTGDPSTGMSFTYITPDDSRIKPGKEFALTYSAEVTSDALVEHHAVNKATINIGNKNDVELDPLPVVIPGKVYADNHKAGDTVSVGDVIAYKITAANFTGDVAYITFSDTTTGGLAFNADSFKAILTDKDGKVTEQAVSPTISGSTFNYKLENVADGTVVDLTYWATVTEEAYKTLEVKNDAKIGINHDPDFSVNTLTNPVNPAPPAPTPNTPTKSGDDLMGLFAALITVLVLGGGVAVYSLRRRRQH